MIAYSNHRPSSLNRAARLFVTLLLGLFAGVLCPGTKAEAARFKKGDQVEMESGSRWVPAVVLDTNRQGEVLVAYEIGTSTFEKKLHEAKLRFPYEAGALSKARNWSDASATFRIMAAPMRITDQQVTLRKEDMTTIQVPIEKLSDADQRYLGRLRRELGPVAGGVPEHPPLEQFSGTDAFQAGFKVAYIGHENAAPLPPDPIPDYMRLREGGAAFTTQEQGYSNTLGVILPVGGPESWLLATVEQRTSYSEKLPTRLVWASIAKKKMENYQLLPPDEVVLDYHPRSNLLLTYNREDKHPTEKYQNAVNLTLWKTQPSYKSVEPILRWNATPPNDRSRRQWARIIDDQTVIQIRDRQEIVGWDIPGKRVKYIVQQESSNAIDPVLSGQQKYVFLPENNQVRVFDPQSGETIMTLPVENGVRGLALNDACTRLAVRDESQLTIWNLAEPQAEPLIYQAEALGGSSYSPMAWLGDDHLMVEDIRATRLFSIPRKMVIWSYKFNYETVRSSNEDRLRHVINNHLVYGATVREGRVNGFAVGNVRLPGPEVQRVTESAGEIDTLIMKPGSKVRLEVRCGDQFNHEVYTVLAEKIEKNGWILTQDPQTPNVMYADMTTGETQSVTYVGLNTSYMETVTVTPKLSSLVLKAGDTTLWTSRTQTHLPYRLQLRSDTTVQQEIERYQQPNSRIFHYANFPPTITDPKYKDGLGTTDVTNRGLVVK